MYEHRLEDDFYPGQFAPAMACQHLVQVDIASGLSNLASCSDWPWHGYVDHVCLRSPEFCRRPGIL